MAILLRTLGGVLRVEKWRDSATGGACLSSGFAPARESREQPCQGPGISFASLADIPPHAKA